MKVLFVTKHTPGIISTKAVRMLRMLEYLPCDLVVCYSVADVYKHIGFADIVLLDFRNYFSYWYDLTFLNKVDVLIAWFYWGLWPECKETVLKMLGAVEVDFFLALHNEIIEEYCPQWLERTFWCPPNTGTWDFQLSRDIDVLFWGSVGYPSEKTYPYREFLKKTLESIITREIVRVDPFLTIYGIGIGGHEYRYAFVKSIPGMRVRGVSKMQLTYGYYGARLYRLLSRTKICCTGPHRQRVPVGKFFENSACGAVTMGIRFIDDEALGFRHGETIWFTDRKFSSFPRFTATDIRFPYSAQKVVDSTNHNFLEDLVYLLENNDVVRRISEGAKELVRVRHSRQVRAQGLYKFLCRKSRKL